MFTLPVSTGYGYVLPYQNGWSRYLHFEAAWLLIATGLLYVGWGFFRRNQTNPKTSKTAHYQPTASYSPKPNNPCGASHKVRSWPISITERLPPSNGPVRHGSAFVCSSVDAAAYSVLADHAVLTEQVPEFAVMVTVA